MAQSTAAKVYMYEKPSRATDARYLFYYAYLACLVAVIPFAYHSWRKVYLRSLVTRRLIRSSGLLTPFRLVRRALRFEIPFLITDLSIEVGHLLNAVLFIGAHVVACAPTPQHRDYGPKVIQIGARAGWIALVNLIALIVSTLTMVPFVLIVALPPSGKLKLHKWFTSSTFILGLLHGFSYGLQFRDQPGYKKTMPFGVTAFVLLIIILTYFLTNEKDIETREWRQWLPLAVLPVVFAFLCAHTSHAYIPFAIAATAYVVDKALWLRRMLSLRYRKIGSWDGQMRDAIVSWEAIENPNFFSLRVPCSSETALRVASGSIFFVRSWDHWWTWHQLYAAPGRADLGPWFLEFFMSSLRPTAKYDLGMRSKYRRNLTPRGSAVGTTRCYLDGPYHTLRKPCPWYRFDRILVVCWYDYVGPALAVALEAAAAEASGGKGRCYQIDFYWSMKERAHLEPVKPRFKELFNETCNSAEGKPELRLRLRAENDIHGKSASEIKEVVASGRLSDAANKVLDRPSTPERMAQLIADGYRRRLKLVREHDPEIKAEMELDHKLRRSFVKDEITLDKLVAEFVYGTDNTSGEGWQENSNSDETYAIVLFVPQTATHKAERKLTEALGKRYKGPSLNFFTSGY